MSGADRRQSGQRGLTLIEVVIMLGLVGMMSMALNQALTSTNSADQYFAAMGRATARGQRVLHDVAGRVTSSRRLLEDSDEGVAYLAACDLSRFPPVADARLPVFDEARNLDRDTPTASHTGNMLLLVTETLPTSCVAETKTARQRVIDTYRMVAVYPHVVDREVVRDKLPTRDIVTWQSVAFPSLQQILEIGDNNERKSVIKDLVTRRGFTHAWDPALPVGAAFHRLLKDGTIEDLPVANMRIDEDPDVTDGPSLVHADVQLAVTDPQDPVRRAVLTVAEADGWQPHGFEIKVSGSPQSRMVWIRVVVQAFAAAAQRVATHASTAIATARDY